MAAKYARPRYRNVYDPDHERRRLYEQEHDTRAKAEKWARVAWRVNGIKPLYRIRIRRKLAQ
jgi:hypothetical protein